jgi:glycosyltransferase involved in cell wall biosynthesis
VKILALVPAYNEGARVANVVKGALTHLPVLVVDDGSTDETAEYAEAAGALLHRQGTNQGKGAALKAGFAYAIQNGYEAVVMLDADMQHDPEEIPQFVQRYAAQRPDLIIGVRKFAQMPTLRRFTNTLGEWMFTWALGTRARDNQSGYRLVGQRLMEVMLASRETNFEFEVEMILECVKHGFQMDWVPIRTIYGDEKSHIRPLRHVVHFFRIVFYTRSEMNRVRRAAKSAEK